MKSTSFEKLQVNAGGTIPSNKSAWSVNPLTKRDMAFAFVLGALALAARLPFVMASQTILHHDEATVGLMAQDILAMRNFPIYFYGQRYMGALEAYIVAALLPFTSSPLTALRLAPALFLSALVGVQYLMVSRWFGRLSGGVSAMAFIAASPLIAHWTISARGGYIEIMLWGALLWWAYSEWFVGAKTSKPYQKVIFGLLIGSGIWLNATMVAFVLPIMLHAFLSNALGTLRSSPAFANTFTRLDKFLGKYALTLPVLILLAAVTVSSLCNVQVTNGDVEYQILFGLVDAKILALLLCCGGGIAVWAFASQPKMLATARRLVQVGAPMVLGLFIGYLPAVGYVVRCSLMNQPVEDAIPLGVRPFWTVGETATYAAHGIPAYLTTDPRPLLDLIPLDQYDYRLNLLSDQSSQLLARVDLFVFMACALLLGLVSWRCRTELSKAMRLQATVLSPAAFVLLALMGFLGLYLFSGCSFDVLSIRYIVPAWVGVAVLLGASVAGARASYLSRSAVTLVLLGWLAGQWHLLGIVGNPHPLQRVAEQLKAEKSFGNEQPVFVAEHSDAKILSFLINQEVRVCEYKSFWPRLAHFNNAKSPLTSYVVGVGRPDAPQRFREWPGKQPPYSNELKKDIRQFANSYPGRILRRQHLLDGFELWTTEGRMEDLESANDTAEVTLAAPEKSASFDLPEQALE